MQRRSRRQWEADLNIQTVELGALKPNTYACSDVLGISSFEAWLARLFRLSDPTCPSAILEPQDQAIGEFYQIQERRSPDFKALKL